jgi:hypothetical protein
MSLTPLRPARGEHRELAGAALASTWTIRRPPWLRPRGLEPPPTIARPGSARRCTGPRTRAVTRMWRDRAIGGRIGHTAKSAVRRSCNCFVASTAFYSGRPVGAFSTRSWASRRTRTVALWEHCAGLRCGLLFFERGDWILMRAGAVRRTCFEQCSTDCSRRR